MIKFFLLILAVLVILSLFGYIVYLFTKIANQKKMLNQARNERYLRVIDSIDTIARAMLANQCNHSEGVLRLKPLLDVLGEKLSDYSAMWALYQVVEEMPIMEERKALARNQRMRLDLTREAAEAEHETRIQTELHALITKMAHAKERYV